MFPGWALKPLIACLAKVKFVNLFAPAMEIVLALLSGGVQELRLDWKPHLLVLAMFGQVCRIPFSL